MENTLIDIGIPINLQKLLDTRLLIQSGSGGGKSQTVRKIVESVGHQVQQIILDPEGEFATLREKFDFALIGEGGDIPLNINHAETLAQKLLETGMSAVIDLYELKPDDRILFVKKFLTALINAPKALWHSCLVYIDEAHIFCPEGSKSESMQAVIDFCTRGRKRGFAPVLATQRLSKLHKSAAAECLNKLIGRTSLDLDRKRAADELEMTSRQDIIDLRKLKPGEFHAFGPAISDEVVKIKVGPVITTHPQAGARITTMPQTPDAIKRILSTMQDLPEEAERELITSQQLREEVTRLRKQLGSMDSEQKIDLLRSQTVELKKLAQQEEVNAAIIRGLRGRIEKLHAAIDAIRIVTLGFDQIENPVKDKPAALLPGKDNLGHKINIAPELIKKLASEPMVSPVVATKAVTTSTIPEDENKKLGRCSLSILQFLATYPRAFSKVQVGISIGYSPNSGGFNNSLSELTSLGLITRWNGLLEINKESNYLDWSGPLPKKVFEVAAYMEKLPKCEREIYEVLLRYPRLEFNKEELSNQTPSKYSSNSGGFNNSIGALNTLGLLVREKGKIKLNPEILELINNPLVKVSSELFKK